MYVNVIYNHLLFKIKKKLNITNACWKYS